MQGRLKFVALIALPLAMLTGCTPKPFTAAEAPGKTVQQVLDRYDGGPKAIVDYNLSGLVKAGSPSGGVTDPKQWVAVAACENKTTIALGVIRVSNYTDSIKQAVKHKQYQRLLTSECS